MDIGFAGIGRMGHHFALHLARAGHRVLAYDVIATLDDELVAAGVEQVDSVDAIVTAPVTFSMLPDGPTTIALLTGDDGLFARAGSGHVHVAMSTMGVDEVLLLADEAERRGIRFADAPVSGSVAGAKAKTLTAMVGTDDATFALIQPLLAAFTKAQFHPGAPSTGMILKLSVNVVIGSLNEAIGESIMLAEKGGIDRELFYEVLRSSAAGGTFVEYKREAFLHPDTAGVDAPVSIIAKDLGLALRFADGLGLSLPGAAASHDVADRALANGLAGADMAAASAVLDD